MICSQFPVLTETDITFLFILVEAGTNLDNNFMYAGGTYLEIVWDAKAVRDRYVNS